MYDTIHFTAFKYDYPTIDFLTDIPPLLSSIINEGDSSHGHYINGYLDYYLVSINAWRIKFQDASLAKSIHGDNVQGMSLQSSREAFQMLSDRLHLDLAEAKVTRIDLGRNLIMQLPTSHYLEYLGEHKHFHRYPTTGGILYKNTDRELLFYDKIKEQKQKRKEIAEFFKERNVLRYEARYKSHLERRFNIDRLTLKCIIEEPFYINLLKKWKEDYSMIKKNKQ